MIMKNVPLARKIYWNASLVIMVIVYAGAYRRHQGHKPHTFRCNCLHQCLFCALDGIRGR